MSKFKSSWVRNTRQKLGGNVYYMLKGQQVARELPASVANPRTDSQMSQRVKLANLVAMYRCMKSFMPKAWENKGRTLSDYNAFVRANLVNSPVALTKGEAASGACVVAPYKVCEGTLSPIELTAREGGFISNLGLGALQIESTTTVADFSAALIANNNGIQYGDQLSFVQLIQQTSDVTGNPYVVMRKYEVTLSSSTDEIGGYLPMDLLQSDNGYLAVVEDTPVGGIFFCLSRKNGSKILVSTQYIVMDDNTVLDIYSSAEHIQMAKSSYGETTEVFLSPVSTGGSNSAVSPTLSILAAKLNSGDYVQGGGYLGMLTPATGFTITLRCNKAGVQTPDSVTMTAYSPSTPQTASSVNVVGSEIVATFGSFAGQSPAPVYEVTATIDGQTYTLRFAEEGTGDGVTE